eukprot:766462-Hanusia_phi.AAC.12
MRFAKGDRSSTKSSDPIAVNMELEDVKKRNLEILQSMSFNDSLGMAHGPGKENHAAAAHRTQESPRRDPILSLPAVFASWLRVTSYNKHWHSRMMQVAARNRSRRLLQSSLSLWFDEMKKQAHIVNTGTRILLRYETLLKMRSLSWYKLSVLQRKHAQSSYLNHKLLLSYISLQKVSLNNATAGFDAWTINSSLNMKKLVQIAFNSWAMIRQRTKKLIVKFSKYRSERMQSTILCWAHAMNRVKQVERTHWMVKRLERERLNYSMRVWRDKNVISRGLEKLSSYVEKSHVRRLCHEYLGSWRRYIDQVIHLHLSLQLKISARIRRNTFHRLMDFHCFKKTCVLSSHNYQVGLIKLCFNEWKESQTRHLPMTSKPPHPKLLKLNFLSWLEKIKFLKRSFRVVIMLRRRALQCFCRYWWRYTKTRAILRTKLQRAWKQANKRMFSQTFDTWCRIFQDRDRRVKDKLWNDFLKSSGFQIFSSAHRNTSNRAADLAWSIDKLMNHFITVSPNCDRREHLEAFQALIASISSVSSHSENVMQGTIKHGDNQAAPKKAESSLHETHNSLQHFTAMEDSSMNSFYSSIERKSPSFENVLDYTEMHTVVEPAENHGSILASTLQECRNLIETFDAEMLKALSLFDQRFQVTEICDDFSTDPQLITAKLYLDIRDWKQDAKFLLDSIIVDIARALNGRREGLRAQFLHDDTPCIEVQVSPQFCRDGRDLSQILKELEWQVHSPDSPLKHGFYTSKVKSIMVQQKSHEGDNKDSSWIELDRAKKKVTSTLFKLKAFTEYVRCFVKNSTEELANFRNEKVHLESKLIDRQKLIDELSRRCDYIETSNRELIFRLSEAHAKSEQLQLRVSSAPKVASWKPNNYWKQLIQNLLSEAEAAHLDCMEVSSQMNAFFNKLDSSEILKLSSSKEKHIRANSAYLHNDLVESKIEYHVLRNKYVKQKEISNYLLYQLQIYKSKELTGKENTQLARNAVLEDIDTLLAEISPQDVTLESDLISQSLAQVHDVSEKVEQISFQEQGDEQTIEVRNIDKEESISELKERISIMQHNYQQTIIQLEESKNQDKQVQGRLLRNLMKFRKREGQIAKMIMMRTKNLLTEKLDKVFGRNNRNDVQDIVFSMWKSLLVKFDSRTEGEKLNLMHPEIFVSRLSPFRIKSVRYSEINQIDLNALNIENRLVEPGDVLLSINSVEIIESLVDSVKMLVEESPGRLVDLEFFSQRNNETYLIKAIKLWENTMYESFTIA